MRVTIEVTSHSEASELLKAPAYVAFLEDFWAWMQGPGRECSLLEASREFQQMAVIHGVILP